MPVLRLLPYAVADGPTNMAADEVLLHSAAAGTASLRFYGWRPATLSLGYFQSEALRQRDARLAALSWLRRPTGGETLVHDEEVTYALALPMGSPWHGSEPWLPRMHRLIAAGLATLGVAVHPHPTFDAASPDNVLCFLHHTTGDLLIDGHKVVGSAQRKQRGALLQHGAILLGQCPATPRLPGIRELTGRTPTVTDVVLAVLHALTADTGWTVTPADWTTEEQQRQHNLVATKYTQDRWNRKR